MHLHCIQKQFSVSRFFNDYIVIDSSLLSVHYCLIIVISLLLLFIDYCLAILTSLSVFNHSYQYIVAWSLLLPYYCLVSKIGHYWLISDIGSGSSLFSQWYWFIIVCWFLLVYHCSTIVIRSSLLDYHYLDSFIIAIRGISVLVLCLWWLLTRLCQTISLILSLFLLMMLIVLRWSRNFSSVYASIWKRIVGVRNVEIVHQLSLIHIKRHRIFLNMSRTNMKLNLMSGKVIKIDRLVAARINPR